MYSTCLHCHKPLGRNDAVEHFPIGRRLAFDSAKGRLWVVCQHYGALESHADRGAMGGRRGTRAAIETPRNVRGAFHSKYLSASLPLCARQLLLGSSYHFRPGGLIPSSSAAPVLAAAAGLRMWLIC